MPKPTLQQLAEHLAAVIVYAENEAHSLDAHGRDDADCEIEAKTAWKIIEAARAALELNGGACAG